MTISIHLNNLQMINDLYSHSQSIGVEMETLLLNLTNQMADLMQDSHDFDVNLVSKLTFDFLDAARKDIKIEKGNITDLETWASVNRVLVYFSFLTEVSSKIENIGSFITLMLNQLSEHKCPLISKILEAKFHESFTIHGTNVSLPDVTYLYSLRDIKIADSMLGANFDDDKVKKTFAGIGPSQLLAYNTPPSELNIPPNFKSCIKDINNSFKNIREYDNLRQFPYHESEKSSSNLFPCNNEQAKNGSCAEYCNWHQKIIQKWPKKQFLSLMKYSIPTRKMKPIPIGHHEKSLIGTLFQNAKIKGDNEFHSGPMSPIIFCMDKLKGYDGDDIGVGTKICNDFFPTPSDSGICLTKNLDIKNILHANDQYHSIFESKLQKQEKLFEGMTLMSEVKLTIYIDGPNDMRQSLPRDTKNSLDEVEFQLHSSKSFAKIFPEDDYKAHLAPLTLQAGKEYFIDVIPEGTEASDEFKSLDYKKRECFTETDQTRFLSTFKMYSQNNCYYDCLVKLAQEQCNCKPWDFLDSNSTYDECDIFGRACFFDTVERQTVYQAKVCPQCKADCESTVFKKEITLEKDIKYPNAILDINMNSFNKGEKWIDGDKELGLFFMDRNNTVYDQSLKDAYSSIAEYDYKTFQFRNALRREKLTIINLRFLQPNFHYVDTKYTFLDKIANFGGKFGLFAQLTGCSLLVIFKIILVTFKTLFTKAQ